MDGYTCIVYPSVCTDAIARKSFEPTLDFCQSKASLNLTCLFGNFLSTSNILMNEDVGSPEVDRQNRTKLYSCR